MKVADQPKLSFHGVDFIEIKFNSINPYDNKTGIDLKVDPKVFYPEGKKDGFKIMMNVSVACKGFFELNVVGIGTFGIKGELSDESLKKNFINSNAPAIMFPYVRSFITTLTSNLGNVTGSLTIPTQFFQGNLPEIQKE